MAVWDQAYEACVLRDLAKDISSYDPTSPEDPGNVAAESEGQVERELLPVLLSAGFELSGRLNELLERSTIRRLPAEAVRLELDSDGLVEIGANGETLNRWSDVEVIRTRMMESALDRNDHRGRQPKTPEEIASWMLTTQSERKGRGEPAGRNVLISLAMKKFGEKQDTVRRAWDRRAGAPKRK